MAKTVETEKLLEGLTLSDEQKAAMTAILGDEKNLETFSRRYLRRDEGTRLSQEAAEAKRVADAATLAAEEDRRKSEAHMQAMGEWELAEKAKLATQQQALEAERLRFKQALLNGGIDPASEEGIRLAAANEEKKTAFDPESLKGQYITHDLGRAIAQQAIELPLQMPAIMAKYAKLYPGVDADWAGFQAQAKQDLLTKGIPVEQTAESFFKFSEKEKTDAVAAVEARIAREVEDKVNEITSKMKLPGGVYVAPNTNDVLFTEKFTEKTRGVDPNAPPSSEELAHFHQVNEALAKDGVRMEY